MSDAPELSREQLQSNWRGWVTTNLGHDPDRAAAAVNAAVAAVLQGRSIATASAAATNAWTLSGGRPPSWRLTYWGLLVEDRVFLGLAGILILVQGLWLSPAGALTLVFDVLLLPPVVLRIVQANRLSRSGIVAPGVLVKSVPVSIGRGTSYAATYQFEHDGPHFASRVAVDTPQGVLVLFDPKNPRRAMVIPTQLSSGL